MKKELYLTVNSEIPYEEVFVHLKAALMGGINKVLLTKYKQYTEVELALIIEMCHNYEAELYIPNDAKFAEEINCDGVHYDKLPEMIELKNLSKEFKYGVTVSAKSEDIQQAIEAKVDYIYIANYDMEGSKDCIDQMGLKTLLDNFKNITIEIYIESSINVEELKGIKNLPIAGIMFTSEIFNQEDITSYFKNIDSILNS
ncbi:MAG: thiamine phosphate synthase [Weeksellaceae bacterium]